MKKNIFFLVLFSFLFGCSKNKEIQEIKPVNPTEEQTDDEDEKTDVSYSYPAASWTAIYASGKSLGFEDKYPSLRKNKTVGIFYFIWQGAHGYDQHEDHSDVQVPSSIDVNSPYDNSVFLKENPEDPQYGPVHAFHHWGKPYLDYYVANDSWVIRKHAQMLSDAGVDVIFLDVSNGYTYQNVVDNLCTQYMAMRKEGNKTPQIAFLTRTKEVVKRLYDNFYCAESQYSDLWFYWKGKPLILCTEEIGYTMASFFTIRNCWFNSNGSWFGNGLNKWTWGDYYPQKPGKNSSTLTEEISVLPATHPTSNIGRSHDENSEPVNPSAETTAKGIYFDLQCKRALSVDPELVFITGWNEWMAMRFKASTTTSSFLGKSLSIGDTYFVDQYDPEYSRDLEPMEGGFGDNYYYYMVNFIRQYKGVKKVDPVSEYQIITIDGDMSDWGNVKKVYTDNKGDIFPRSHYGYGLRVGTLTNNTGRNDIVTSKVSSDGENLYFYVKTNNAITSWDGDNWMRLFVSVAGVKADNWEGFQYVINNKVNGESSTTLEKSTEGWNWEKVSNISYKLSNSEMEISVPLSLLGITNSDDFTIDFKWVDNAVTSGDIQECMRDGDSAPNGRFRYRYCFKK